MRAKGVIAAPYLLFVGDVAEPAIAKTAVGVCHWRPESCAGQFRLTARALDLGLPEMTMTEAAGAGVKTVIVGVAPAGGNLPPGWIAALEEALSAGLDIASGLHERLGDIPRLRDAASRTGRRIFDVRQPTQAIPLATGVRRTGKRLLTVGTDCAVGKMFTALAITRELRARGLDADFRATGQTGILIAGVGISVDAVVADFISGAAETLSPNAPKHHWDIVEGQGSLFHPSYAGVSLGLLHGSQPDVIVLCHDVSRRETISVEGFPLPDIHECIALNLAHAHRVNPAARCAGVSVNTSSLNDGDAKSYLDELSAHVGLPAVDPARTGVGAIVDELDL